MVAENMTTLVRRAVLSLFMTRNRVVDKEMYLVRLALNLFWDDNVIIIPEFDLVDAERQASQTTLRTVQIRSAHYRQEYFKSNLLLKSQFNWVKVKESKDHLQVTQERNT